jgi:hypothetical protein
MTARVEDLALRAAPPYQSLVPPPRMRSAVLLAAAAADLVPELFDHLGF